MKIEHILARYLYAVKQLTLQGIGTFSLSPDFIMPAETDKDASIPAGSIIFTQNTKATEDPALIDFIVQQTRKMKPLASSDLESFIVLGSQFLNIGKPFKIEGVGVLEKNQLGDYIFTQYGQVLNTKAEEAPVQKKEKAEERISFASEEKPKSIDGKKITALLAALIVLGGIGWALWYFVFNKKETDSAANNITVPANTPAAADTAKKDTAALQPAVQKTDINIPVTANNAAYSFKVVIKNYPSLAIAQKRFDILTSYGHKLIMYTTDSVTYKVAMPFSLPLSDTTYVKDSVRKALFGGNPYIELK